MKDKEERRKRFANVRKESTDERDVGSEALRESNASISEDSECIKGTFALKHELPSRTSYYKSNTEEEVGSEYDPEEKKKLRNEENRRISHKRHYSVKNLYDEEVNEDFEEDKVERRGKRRGEMGHMSKAVKKQFLKIAAEREA